MEKSTMNPDAGNGGSGASVMDAARQQVQPVLQQTQQKAGQAMAMARTQVMGQLDSQIDRAAGGLGNAAQMLRQTGQQFRDHDQSWFAGYIESAAGYLEQFSRFLNERDAGQMIGEVENFARREPALFLGGAFALGFLGSRFLKSSSPNAPLNDVYPQPDFAGAQGRREYASSGPFTGPAHDMAAMSSPGGAAPSATYVAPGDRNTVGAAAPGTVGPQSPPGSMGLSTTAPGTAPAAADTDFDEEEFAPTASTTGRSSSDQ